MLSTENILVTNLIVGINTYLPFGSYLTALSLWHGQNAENTVYNIFLYYTQPRPAASGAVVSCEVEEPHGEFLQL